LVSPKWSGRGSNDHARPRAKTRPWSANAYAPGIPADLFQEFPELGCCVGHHPCRRRSLENAELGQEQESVCDEGGCKRNT
jgi:hypothetical protein